LVCKRSRLKRFKVAVYYAPAAVPCQQEFVAVLSTQHRRSREEIITKWDNMGGRKMGVLANALFTPLATLVTYRPADLHPAVSAANCTLARILSGLC
jgi:hypothetical protein